CNADITQEAAPFDPFDRRISKKHAKLIVAQTEIIAQRHAHRGWTCRYRGSARYLGKTIPRAGIKTIVATKNSVPDKWSKLERDRTFKFDCQIRNAAARIQTVRGRDCAGGTGFDTVLARSTAIRHRLVRRQFES